MNNLRNFRDAALTLLAGAGAVGVIIGIIVCLGYMWNNTAGAALNDWLTTTPEEQAAIFYKEEQQRNDEQAAHEAALKDPSSQESIAADCVKRGGVPRYSNWDGEIFKCQMDGDK